MGYDLSGDGGYFRANVSAWSDLLQLAHQYGWEPAGTETPEWENEEGEIIRYDEWDGGYGTNDYQLVTAEDAAAIADAIEASLDDIPDEAVKVLTLGEAWGANCPPELRDKRIVNDEANLYERWSGPDSKDYLKAFIAYCRAGSFRIG